MTEAEPNITRPVEPVRPVEPLRPAEPVQKVGIDHPSVVDPVADSDAQRATFAQLRAGAPTELPSSNYTVPIAAAGMFGLFALVLVMLRRRRSARR